MDDRLEGAGDTRERREPIADRHQNQLRIGAGILFRAGGK